MERELEFIENLKEHIDHITLKYLCDWLRKFNSKYNWVGIYVLNDNKLVLDSFSGEKTEHEQLSLGSGLCSLAVLNNKIINEPDVKSNSEFIACFVSTESELVVPIRKNGKAIGEIDIDSDTKSAFTKSDEQFLSAIAEIIASKKF